MILTVMYRGPLSSCNYACRYCPFAKRLDSRRQIARDRQSLARFVGWLTTQTSHEWQILFTPWGEALVRDHYRKAIAELSWRPHIQSVAIQTNLSIGLTWLGACRVARLAFWATYHPTEANADQFLRKVHWLHAQGAAVSVGMVGVPQFLEVARRLRERLSHQIYMWINAQQPRQRAYTDEEASAWQAIDPGFTLAAQRQPSLGRNCRAGHASFTVDGNGDMRRCHFVDEIIGNIHDPDCLRALQPRICPRKHCDCFLGKSQLDPSLEMTSPRLAMPQQLL